MNSHSPKPSESTVSYSSESDSGYSTLDSPSKDAQTNRTLVLCFDGTGDKFDRENSNVVQFCHMLKKDDRSKQLVYYQTGIGTYTVPYLSIIPFMAKASKVWDDMVAWNIHTHIMDGYNFLMQYYTPGDKICLFGFSRGAYTARCLAGMLQKVGLLLPGNIQHIPFAYHMYLTDQGGWKQSNMFKHTFSMDVKVEFVGVWDTVSSVGVISQYLPFTTSNTMIRSFRHAVSLDERRACFKANLWHWPDGDELKLCINVKKNSKRHSKLSFMRGEGSDCGSECDSVKKETNVLEVWFAGCHCDIGGGSITNNTPHKLSRIPLRWMIRECFKTNSGILFDRERLEELGLDADTITRNRPDALPAEAMKLEKRKNWWSWLLCSGHTEPEMTETTFTRRDSCRVVYKDVHETTGELVEGTEEEEELMDAMMPKYDQLHENWAWWILEVLPMKHMYPRQEDKWDWLFGWVCVRTVLGGCWGVLSVLKAWVNFGRGRCIPEPVGESQRVKVHRSVRTRMEAAFHSGKRYQPRATFRGKRLDLSSDVDWVE